MSAIPCPVCGQLRKVEQVWTPAGWINPPCYRCGDPGWVQPDDADDPLAGRPADAFYRVWFELDPPLHRWYWWLVERGLTWPTKAAWLRKAEDGVRQIAERQGMTLIGDPLAEAVELTGSVVVRASAMASGPLDVTAPSEHGPEGIDG